MAEILLSLTIIGVVAAITLPSLTGNINERTWNTQRKALYARMSQAISLMPALNGFGILTESVDGSGSTVVTADTAAETFVTSGLSKVLKINNICSNEHIGDCGFPSTINILTGGKIDTPTTMNELNPNMTNLLSTRDGRTTSAINTKAVAFETANGESILTFYNPRCRGDLKESPWNGYEGVYFQNMVCANFIYDLNGKKGPNTVGKDIGFVIVMYPSDVKVASPVPVNRTVNQKFTVFNAPRACSQQDSNWRLPNVTEAYSMFVNKNLIGFPSDIDLIWTSDKIVNGGEVRGLIVGLTRFIGQVDDPYQYQSRYVWCVER